MIHYHTVIELIKESTQVFRGYGPEVFAKSHEDFEWVMMFTGISYITYEIVIDELPAIGIGGEMELMLTNKSNLN